MNILLVTLPIILYLGIITSYTDIKEGKIKNKELIITIILGLIVYTIISIIAKSPNIILQQIIHGTISFCIGFLIWYLGLWSAGDAKLFSVYSFIVPVDIYKLSVYNFTPFNLLANTLIPLTAFLIFQLLYKTSIKNKIEAIKTTFNPKRLGVTIMTLFALGWIIQHALIYINIKSNIFTNMFIIILLSMIIEKIWTREKYYIYSILIILNFFLNQQQILSLNYLKSFVLMIFIYTSVRTFINELGKIFDKDIVVNKLKKGMIPAEYIERKNAKKNDKKVNFELVKIKNTLFSNSQLEHKNLLFQPHIEGLTTKDISLIKRFGFESLKIQTTLPFAPFFLLGTMITILFQGSLVLGLHTLL